MLGAFVLEMMDSTTCREVTGYLSKRLRRHLPRALRFFMILASNAGLPSKGLFGEARLKIL
jgi:hypothetical protein